MTTRQYKQFGKSEFEYELRGILIRSRLGYLKDITDEYRKENPTWERIYTISTKNRAVKILVFSSIDIRTGFVREHGDDAIRLVMEWTTRNGKVYKKIAKHLRIKTLFGNMEKSITQAQQEVFNLKYNEFYERKDL
jgi:hypothetical protein